MTIYSSPEDKALATSGWLFGSIARLGRLDQALLTPEQIEHLRTLGFIDVIQVSGTPGFIGHSYFVSNPKASSDMIALLRYGLRPSDPGRSLEGEKHFWRIPAGQGTGATK
jgi:esterase/lipase superfamily enzyme